MNMAATIPATCTCGRTPDAWDRLRKKLPLGLAETLAQRVDAIESTGASARPEIGLSYARGKLVNIRWDADESIPIKGS